MPYVGYSTFCWSFTTFTDLQYSSLKDNNFSGRITFFTSYLVGGLIFGYIYTFIVESMNPDEITTVQLLSYPIIGALGIGIIFTVLDYTLGILTSNISLLDFIILFFENIWLISPYFFFFISIVLPPFTKMENREHSKLKHNCKYPN